MVSALKDESAFILPLWPSALVLISFYICLCLISVAHQHGSSCWTVFLKMLKPQAWNFTEKEILICKYHHPSISLWLNHGENPEWFVNTPAHRHVPYFTPLFHLKGDQGPDAYVIPTLIPYILKITKGKGGKENYLVRMMLTIWTRFQYFSSSIKIFQKCQCFCLKNAYSILTLIPGKPCVFHSMSSLVWKIQSRRVCWRACNSGIYCEKSLLIKFAQSFRVTWHKCIILHTVGI